GAIVSSYDWSEKPGQVTSVALNTAREPSVRCAFTWSRCFVPWTTSLALDGLSSATSALRDGPLERPQQTDCSHPPSSAGLALSATLRHSVLETRVQKAAIWSAPTKQARRRRRGFNVVPERALAAGPPRGLPLSARPSRRTG